jgi:hypothetical protein
VATQGRDVVVLVLIDTGDWESAFDVAAAPSSGAMELWHRKREFWVEAQILARIAGSLILLVNPVGRFSIELINREGGEELAEQLVLFINNK